MNYTETLDLISRNTNTQNSTTSSYPIAAKTIDVNNALNQYFILANMGAGNWRPADDTNQTDYPVIFFDLVAGQKDYVFTVDEQGNQILDVYKVRILQPNGIDWTTLEQINVDRYNDEYLNTTTTGVPDSYYLTANGLFIVNPSNYNMTGGIQIFISRTSTYFTVSDTTKKAGIPWVHHEYLALRPSYFYCLQKGLPQAVDYRKRLYGEDGKSGMEGDIKQFYRDRNHNFSAALTSQSVNPY